MSLGLYPAQKGLRDSPTARRWPCIHSLDLCIVLEHRDAAAPDRDAVQPRHKEAHMRLEKLLDRQPMPLMLFVGRTEHVVEFSDQVTRFDRCLDRLLNRDIHGSSVNVNMLGSLGGRSESRPPVVSLHLSREGLV